MLGRHHTSPRRVPDNSDMLAIRASHCTVDRLAEVTDDCCHALRGTAVPGVVCGVCGCQGVGLGQLVICHVQDLQQRSMHNWLKG